MKKIISALILSVLTIMIFGMIGIVIAEENLQSCINNLDANYTEPDNWNLSYGEKSYVSGIVRVKFKDSINVSKSKDILNSYNLTWDEQYRINTWGENSVKFKIFVQNGSEFEWICKFEARTDVDWVLPEIIGTGKGDSCQNLYWFDNDNKNCSQKQFCGTYMYLGLQTFESKTQCEKALNNTPKCVTDADCSQPNCVAETNCMGMTNKCIDGKCKLQKTCPNNSNEENSKCYKTLSNGRKAEIKIMPETASATAIARLGELNFTIELKEVGKETKDTSDDTVVYELTGKKQGKFLGIFKIMASERVQVDAETGEVKKVIKPWWSFLASGL